MVGGGGGFERLLKITVLEVAAGKVKLGFEVDAGVPVHRLEIWERMCARGELDSRGADPGATQSDRGEVSIPALTAARRQSDRTAERLG